MPDELTTILSRLPATLHGVAWAEPAQLRRKAVLRRRTRYSLVAGLVLLTVAGTLTHSNGSGSYGRPTSGAITCPPHPGPIDVDPEPSQIRIRVVDATGQPGRAAAVIVDLGSRGFTLVTRTPEPATIGPAADLVAAIRFGPSQFGAAMVLLAHVPDGAATIQVDVERRDGTVDLVLGPRFERLATAAEANQPRHVEFDLAPGTCVPSRR